MSCVNVCMCSLFGTHLPWTTEIKYTQLYSPIGQYKIEKNEPLTKIKGKEHKNTMSRHSEYSTRYRGLHTCTITWHNEFSDMLNFSKNFLFFMSIILHIVNHTQVYILLAQKVSRSRRNSLCALFIVLPMLYLAEYTGLQLKTLFYICCKQNVQSIPILLYRLEACPLRKTDLSSPDFVVNRFYTSLFTKMVAHKKKMQTYKQKAVQKHTNHTLCTFTEHYNIYKMY